MIGLTFSLSFMLVFMFYVMVNDFIIMVLAELRDVERHFSQDQSIFPDHAP